MAGLLESAAAILSGSERRLEALSQNITNASTPGYKNQVSFSRFLENSQQIGDYTVPISFNVDHKNGRLTETGNPLDLAIVGEGLFMVRDSERFYYTRAGQFSRNSDGAVINGEGMILQQAGGGDLIIDSSNFEILGDGTVLDDGAPVGTVGLFEAADMEHLVQANGSLFTASAENMSAAGDSVVRQGLLEGSNVVLSDEMIHLMGNARLAEMGGQLVRTYDELIGQAITTFSRSGQ